MRRWAMTSIWKPPAHILEVGRPTAFPSALRPDPASRTEQTKVAIRCGSLYGGSAQGDLIPGDVMALNLTASGVNVDSLFSPVAGYPVLKGTLTGSASFTARSTSPAAFLSSLKGKGEALIEKGNLSLSRAKKKNLAFSQLRVAFQGAGSRTQGTQPRYAYTGKWQGSLTTPAGQSSLDLTGALQFPTSGPFNLFADAVSASGKLSANGHRRAGFRQTVPQYASQHAGG